MESRDLLLCVADDMAEAGVPKTHTSELDSHQDSLVSTTCEQVDPENKKSEPMQRTRTKPSPVHRRHQKHIPQQQPRQSVMSNIKKSSKILEKGKGAKIKKQKLGK